MIIQFLLTAVFLLTLFVTWRRARQQAIRRWEAIVWSAFWLGATALVWRPTFSTVIANLVGIGRGSDLIFYLSIVLLFVLVFRQFVAMDRMERHITS
ncbi:MAG: DUF2304 family protein, partial [Patescibacteria group bacterium]